MSEIKSTRLRHIVAKTPEEIESVVNNLPFKIEIKGAPQKQGASWFLWFVIPDNIAKFESIDLTGI